MKIVRIFAHRVELPLRKGSNKLRKARRALTDAACRFLERCRKEGLLSEAELSEASRNLAAE